MYKIAGYTTLTSWSYLNFRHKPLSDYYQRNNWLFLEKKDMDIGVIVEQITKQAGNVAPLGARFKFVLDDNPIHIDGSGDTNVVTTEDKEADCTISTTMENMIKLKSGDLNPMMAVMTGKIKIDGDMALAMKLQSLI